MILESVSLLTMLMMPPLVITALDFKLAATWLKLELTVAFALVACIWLYSLLSKWFKPKPLGGSTVLITNGQSALSKELASQLTSIHQCRVILLTNQMAAPVPSDLHRAYSCNFLNSTELRRLVGKIQSTTGIDILIENGVSSESVVDCGDVKQFIERTSHSIMATINLLMNFIPVLAQSQYGHYVTIQPTIQAARPFLEARSEVRELISHLQSIPADGCIDDHLASLSSHSQVLPVRQNLKLSTIVLHGSQDSCQESINLSVAEVAQRVIAGIRTESRMMSVNAKRSRIEYSWRKVRRFLGRS